MDNLNHDSSSLRLPSEMVIIETFDYLTRRSATMKLTAHIPMNGYVPTETIIVTGEVINKNHVHVLGIRCYLVKIINYFACGKEKEEIEKVKKALVETKIPEGDRDFKFNLELTVPVVSPTDFKRIKVIHQRYAVIVKALVSEAFRRDPFVTLPITIGTAPLSE
jgi:Arrestin (or S-antigen), C-terminal domain